MLERCRKLLTAPVTIAALCCLTTGAHGADLVTALKDAIRNDPQLREAEANLLAAREAKPQAWSALLPQINAQGSIDRGRATGLNSFTGFGGSPIITEFDNRTFQGRALSLQIRQSLFRWDQFVGLGAAADRIMQAEADYQVAELNLFQRVAQRYFDVLGAQSDLDAVVTTKEAVARQLEQAETRFDVGLIAVTDVREAQAAYDQAVADEIQSKRALGTAYELLREVTGEYYGELLAPGDLPLAPPTPSAAQDWVAQALAQNRNVVSAKFGVSVASNEIRTRRAQHYPTLDLVVRAGDNFTNQRTQQFNATQDLIGGFVPDPANPGNFIDIPDGIPDARQPAGEIFNPGTGQDPFDFRPEDGVNDALAFNPADRESRDYSFGLQFTVPIYSGGFRGSRVREAVYLERAAKERLVRAQRETERLTRDSYAGVLSEIARVGALEKALESSRTALQATEAGFEVGTRTTVDVLNARRDLARARTNYERSRYVYILNLITLKLAAGQLNAEDLAAINQSLTEPVAQIR